LGIIKPGYRLDQKQIEFAYGVDELCAAVGDRYGDPSDGNAGEHSRPTESCTSKTGFRDMNFVLFELSVEGVRWLLRPSPLCLCAER